MKNNTEEVNNQIAEEIAMNVLGCLDNDYDFNDISSEEFYEPYDNCIEEENLIKEHFQLKLRYNNLEKQLDKYEKNINLDKVYNEKLISITRNQMACLKVYLDILQEKASYLSVQLN